MTNHEFNELLWQFYTDSGRHDLPWRLPDTHDQFDPYKIVVSEIMLQQTQVGRVIPKYHEFLMKFPTVQALAGAELGQVIGAWSGLGYNRRAKYLWQTAQIITGMKAFPENLESLVALPGIGKNTAGAVLAYAYNKPAIFVETNIRTVYIHHFFRDFEQVSDTAIVERLQATVDTEHPREFYWALMDYGSYLKQTVGNVGRLSKTYAKQSKFEGSRRQIRGLVLAKLGQGERSETQLRRDIPDDRLVSILEDLVQENLVQRTDSGYKL